METFDPIEHRIFEGIVGSKLYGTSTPESDLDTRGVCIPPIKVQLNPFENFEQKDSGFEEEDRTIYSLSKFMKLCADSNPNIVELLFVPEDKILFKTKEWDYLIENRHFFLSTKAKFTFTGYAFSQLNKIKSHRQWFVDPPKKKPERKDFGLGDKPIISGENLSFLLNTPLDIFKEAIQEELNRERAYREEKKKWDNYVAWRDNRNPKRRVTEEKYGYDCYAEETEFLTNSGWKYYEEVKSNDLLGTINPKTHAIEFEPYTSRVKYSFDGNLYRIKNQCTQCLVTGNHKLFVSRLHRSIANNFSTKYSESNANWILESVDKLKSKRYSHYSTINFPNNNNKEFDIPDDYLKIMGLYASEGSAIKYHTKDSVRFKGISISQLENPNKIYDIITSIQSYKIHHYKHLRKGRNEITYNIYNKELATRLVQDCFQYSKSKELPDWIFKLSSRQSNVLLDALMAGDGTNKEYSKIYYTYSKKLADKVQALGLQCGYASKIWEYEDKKSHNKSYQVYFSRFYGQFGFLDTNKMISPQEYHGNVVCFEVNNSILITRLNGECSFNGNSKYASHIFRLMSEGKELLLTGKITFPLPNAFEITAIKNGFYEYEEMIERAEAIEKEFEMWYNESILPKFPDRNALTEVYYNILDMRGSLRM